MTARRFPKRKSENREHKPEHADEDCTSDTFIKMKASEE